MPNAKEILPRAIGLPALPRKLVPYTQRHKADQFLGAFAKLRKATINFFMSVRLSVLMEQLGFHWTDFHEILYLRIFRKICPENSGFTEMGQK